jgi:hypothetical protein
MQKVFFSGYHVHMHLTFPAFWSWRALVFRSLMLYAGMVVAEVSGADDAVPPQSTIVVTNLSQVRRFASQNPAVSFAISLEGDVWWADWTRGELVLSDDSGAERLEMNLDGRAVQSGQRVRITGNGTIIRGGSLIRIGAKGPVVDNDGVHGMVEKSGAVYLKSGRHPLLVDWFNGEHDYGLEVGYTGPDLHSI